MLRFGEFELDPGARQLRRAGRRVELEPQGFALLLYLVEHAGEVVSRDEIRSAVWGERATAPSSVWRSISLLRRALGDGDARLGWLRTVHGRGYCFAGEVEHGDLRLGERGRQADQLDRRTPD